jgi:hypothetical protein
MVTNMFVKNKFLTNMFVLPCSVLSGELAGENSNTKHQSKLNALAAAGSARRLPDGN